MAVIKLKKSETALSKPTSSDIVVGEVALNAKDQRIFVRDSNGDIITVGEAGGIRHESSAVTFKVTVATKDATHRYNGSGSSSGYKIDGSFSPTLILAPGNTYKFDQADSSNSGHPLLFYYEAAKTTAYSTGVTTSGTPGSSGAYTQIVVSDSTPLVLHYQCSSHGLMGNQIVTNTRNYTGTDTDDISEGSSNLYFTNARADARITNALKDEDNMASNSATHVPSQQSVKAYVDGQTTDETAEGSTNLYFTNARADARITNALVDEDNMASDSATKVPSQQSVKAYVDSSVGGASSLTVQEEGSSLSTAATTLNFVGSGVTASGTGATKTITVSGGGGSSTGNTTDITQSSHGLAAKDAIRHNGSSWVKAQADDNSTLALGIVTAVADSNTFTVAQAGRFTISSHGLTVGQWYYLSSSSAGGLTATEPAISQPIVYVESASVIFVYPYRPTNILLDGSSGVTPGDNTVTSAKIVDGTIVTADLADDAITSAKIADDAITSALIADDAVTSALIADNTITVGNMAAGTLKTPGSNNLAIGTNALIDGSLSGNHNLAVGIDALKELEGGTYNVAIGNSTLKATTSGGYNVALGAFALEDQTTANYNVAIGYTAARDLTTGVANVFIGATAAYVATEPSYTVGIGYQALYDVTTANHNVAIGLQTMFDTNTGHSNTAVGNYSMYGNTTGYLNTAYGYASMYSAAGFTGIYNAAFGTQAGYAITTGYNNTFCGGVAGYALTEGHSNSLLGVNTGYAITTGDNNTCVGANAGRTASPSGNITTGNNIVCLGDNSVANLYCADTSISSSDERDKAEITNFTHGLSWVKKMRPVTYKWDKRSWYLGEDEEDITKVTRDGSKKKSKVNIGLIAQEVLEIEKADSFSSSKDNMLVVNLNEDDTGYGIKYERIVPILINAIKELETRLAAVEG